ncbi:peroxiredoxin [soil metagenome]
MALRAGEAAPDFELTNHRRSPVKLSDFKGKKNVVLAFHPMAFTPVCANQMTGLETDLQRFEQADAVVFGISTDPQPSKAGWATALGGISFDMLSDFHPHGAVSRQYDVYNEKDGVSARAVFVIDKQGRIAWSKLYEMSQQPDNGEILAALDGVNR